MNVLTFANRKGGVGKTSSAANLAAEFEAMGKRVLCVDLDPQGTLTYLAGHDPAALASEQTTIAALTPEAFEGIAAPNEFESSWGSALWPANNILAGAEVQLTAADTAGPNVRLRRAIEERAGAFDLVLVDTPPSLGKLAINGLCAADHLVFPVGCSIADVVGLTQMFDTVNMLRKYGEAANGEVLGVFATRADHTRHSRETIEGMRSQLGELFLDTVIPRGVALQDAQTNRQAVREYDAHSKPSIAYGELAAELGKRIVKKTGEKAWLRDASKRAA